MRSFIILSILFYMGTPALGADEAHIEKAQQVGFVANSPLKSQLTVNNKKMDINGRVSLNLTATQKQLERGVIEVKDINLLFYDVNQSLLSNRRTRGKKEGVVGFSRNRSKKQLLRYDQRDNTLVGSIKGFTTFPQLMELNRRPLSQKEDLMGSPLMHAKLKIKIKLEDALPQEARNYVRKIVAQINIRLETSQNQRYKINRYVFKTKIPRLILKYVLLLRFEASRRICIQPVGIKSSANDLTPTGHSFAFGEPQNRMEWRKSNIVFSIRNWKYIVNPSLVVANTSSEKTQIRNSIQDDDCIEVFFVENFDPVDSHGGGATWAGGTASAQIITSDGNNNGIDFTHLAHEMGHVLGLHHPGAGAPNASWPNLTDGSTGTLLCPSGWRNDNPQVNSQENKHNVSNPLLTFSLKLRSTGPDCLTSADCGACY